MSLLESELILNSDGSVYHLHLKPEHIADTIIFVGDPDRVEIVTQLFDSIEFSIQKREFKTQTGKYRGIRLSVISTGIGADNIDIVMNELDALVNIDFSTRTPKKTTTSLNIIRIGTSGALQKDIPIDAFLMSSYGLDINGMLRSYQTEAIANSNIENAFVNQTDWSTKKAFPLVIENDNSLASKLDSADILKGMTATANGFYAPQSRVLRLPLEDASLQKKITNFNFEKIRVTNLEMETAAIYGLAKLLGHKACSMNAILANRITGDFSKTPSKTIDKLIQYTLDKLVSYKVLSLKKT